MYEGEGDENDLKMVWTCEKNGKERLPTRMEEWKEKDHENNQEQDEKLNLKESGLIEEDTTGNK